MTSLSVLNHEIHQDDGLYCLNDLHKASGGLEKHQPAFFMRNQETKDLIAELEKETKVSSANLQTIIKKITGKGLHQGTYACKEIVYRYAMWISPKFALAVIRVFDAFATGKLEPKAKPKTTVADRVPLKDAVNVLVAKSALNYSDAYKMVHQFMGVDSIDQIPLEDLPRAVAYVHSLTLVSNNTTSLEVDEQKKKVSKLITAIWQLSAMTGATFLQTVILYDRGRLDYYKSYYRGVHRACADLVNAFDLKGHGNVPLLVGQTITTPSGVRFNIDSTLI